MFFSFWTGVNNLICNYVCWVWCDLDLIFLACFPGHGIVAKIVIEKLICTF